MTNDLPQQHKLLPCPFCGEPAKVLAVNIVGCSDTWDCAASIDLGHFTIMGPDVLDMVVARWNARADRR